MRHILYCYRPGARADEALREACRLALREDAMLSVGLVRQTGPVPDGCCGVSAAKWGEILDDVDGEVARRARAIARSEHAAPRVVVLAGARPAEVISAYARDQDCDVIAVAARTRRPGGSPLSRRTLRDLRQTAGCEVVELDRSESPEQPAQRSVPAS